MGSNWRRSWCPRGVARVLVPRELELVPRCWLWSRTAVVSDCGGVALLWSRTAVESNCYEVELATELAIALALLEPQASVHRRMG